MLCISSVVLDGPSDTLPPSPGGDQRKKSPTKALNPRASAPVGWRSRSDVCSGDVSQSNTDKARRM